jgi:uncharacterized protein YqgC (DUF456 family)
MFDVQSSILAVPVALVLLIAALALGLLLIPFGLPGLWMMVLGVIGYGWLTGFATVGVAMIAIVLTLAALGEIVEAWVGFRSARRYGGSRRAGWGAMIGGLVGAAVGVPVPVVGSIIGAFVGAFAGAAVFEYTVARRAGTALGAGWGAVVGRAVGAAVKVALGLMIAVVAVFAVLRG